MPITIQPAKLKYKNPQTSEYVPVAAVATYSGLIDDTAGNGDTNNVWSADKSYNTINSKLDAPVSAGASGQVLMCNGNGQSWQTIIDDTSTASNEAWSSQKTSTEIGAVDNQVIISATQPQAASNKLWISNDNSSETLVPTYAELTAVADSKISDVRIDNTSVVTSGVANIPTASNNTYGVVKVNWNDGIGLTAQNTLTLNRASQDDAKAANNAYKACVAYWQHCYAFYGLAKAAGDSTQSSSNNPVGTYTDNAKSAIQSMLNVPSATDTHLTGIFTLGDRDDTIIGRNSVSFGSTNLVAGAGAFSVGYHNYVYGSSAQAFGAYCVSSGNGSTTFGYGSVTEWNDAFTIGHYNYRYITEGPWQSGTSYEVGQTVNYGSYVLQCINANSETESPSTVNWTEVPSKSFIVGNGTENARSNALTLENSGKLSISDYVYVGANADGSGGTRLPHDIQINGTSIVSNGVANIPIASTSLGAVKIDSDYGVTANGNGRLYVNKATSSQIPLGTSQYRPIVPYNQHEAAFYGLAKAAGDTSQASSSNNVGEYTSDALVAIQKMLGTYEAPWELIREDTVVNSTSQELIISVDDNGNSFQLTDAVVVVIVPTQNTDFTMSDYCRVYFRKDGTNIRTGFLANNLSKTFSANNSIQIGYAKLKQEHGLMTLEYVEFAVKSNHAYPRITTTDSKDDTNTPNGIKSTYIDSIKIAEFVGTLQYRILGRRKWR